MAVRALSSRVGSREHTQQTLALLGVLGIALLARRLARHELLGSPYAFMLLAGAVFGILLQRTRFCLLCIFRDFFLYRHGRPLLMVLGAIAVGSLGYLLIFESWIPDPSEGWLPPQAHIGPVGLHLALGGLVFGAGMGLSGSCISSHLYRLGEGSVSGVPALVGTAAGFLLGFRVWNTLYLRLVEPAPVIWLPASLGYGGAAVTQGLVLVLLTALVLRVQRRGPSELRRPVTGLRDLLRRVLGRRWGVAAGAAGIGALAVAVYFKVEPLGVTAELGRLVRGIGGPAGLVPERLNGLDTLAGCSTALTGEPVTTNALFVSALVGGSLISALARGRFRLVLPSPAEAARGLVGGVMLGFGAMVSLGCSIGTFLSGSMALSVSGWVFGGFMATGIWLSLRLQGKRAGERGCASPAPLQLPDAAHETAAPQPAAHGPAAHQPDGVDTGFVAVSHVAAEMSRVSHAESAAVPQTGVQLIEIGRSREAFENGHIPGARYLPWETVSTTVNGVEGEFPAPAVVMDACVRAGIDPALPVIAYDDTGGSRAARLVFALRVLGAGQVQLLDGGLIAWIAAGHPVEPGPDPQPRQTSHEQARLRSRYSPPETWPGLISADELAARHGELDILDTRSAPEYAGEDLRAARGGHIPGSINIDWEDALHPHTRQLLPVAELRSRYGRFVDSPRPLVVMCHSGARACQTMEVLRMLGRAAPMYLYDGSWTEWADRMDLPVERGRAPKP